MSTAGGALPVEPAAAGVARIPLCFGPAARPLFGWSHAPADGGTPRMAVAICPPLGHEYINTHRSIRHLADRLARAGIVALRFDYDGTGDSAGRDEDPDRLAAWIGSVHEALRVLRAESGCTEIGLAGLRMGATLAAITASDIDVSSLVLWAPCTRGRAFLRELNALSLTSYTGARRSPAAAEFEVNGFLATADLQRDLGWIDLETIVPRARRVLLVARDDVPESPRLAETWTAAGVAVERRVLPGYAEMGVAPHNTVVPHAAIDAIAAWIAEGAKVQRDGSPKVRASQSPTVRETRDPAVRAVSLDGPGSFVLGSRSEKDMAASQPRVDSRALDGVRESVFWFGDDGFGILSEPAAPIDARAPAVVISNAGSAHHVGPNRLHVQLARALSRAGFRCLRLDLPGLGDSVARDRRENVPYPADASAIVGDAVMALSRRASTPRFVLMGLCSGAHTAFHAALDLDRCPIVEAILINPLTFRYVPGMSLDAPSEPHAARWGRYRRAMGSVRGWTKLARRDVPITTIAQDVVTRAGLALGRGRVARAWRPWGRESPATELTANLRRLAASRRHLTLVFSRFDPGYDLLMMEAGRTAKSLRKRGDLDLSFIDGANHTFDAKDGRTALIRTITGALTRRYLTE